MQDGYYIHVGDGEKPKGIWRIENGTAERVGITNPKGGPNSYVKAEPGEPIADALGRTIPVWFGPEGKDTLRKLSLAPGEYFPRMARPSDQHPYDRPGRCPGNMQTQNEIATMQGQLIALTRELQSICQTVHPSPETFN